MVSAMMAETRLDLQNDFQENVQSSFRNDTTSLYFADFEGTLDWTSLDLTMPSGMWHVDDFDTPDGTGMAWWMGDTDINGYLDHSYLILDTPEILVPPGGHLTFDLNYNVEGTAGAEDPYNGWDGSNVRISTDAGANWTVISGSPSYNSSSLYSFGYEHGEGANIAGWGGSSNGWVSADFDLSTYSGQNVMIRFAFASDPSYSTVDNTSMFGIIVDNIVLGDFSNNGVDDGTMVSGSMVPVAGDLWHVYEDATAPSPSHAVGCFDPSTNTYNPGMENYFISPEIVLPNESDALFFFDFSFKAGLDNGDFPDTDYLYVEVENDGVWYSVSNPTGDLNLPNYVFTGSTDIWSKWSESYDYSSVTELAGQTIRFRVGLHSNADTPTTLGFHIDDFEVTQISYNSIPMVQNINLEAGDGVISLAWDPIGGGGGGSEELAYDTDDGSGSAFQNGIFSASGIFVAGEYFNAPFGATTTVTTAKIFGYESNTETETTLYGYAAAGNIIDAVPTYSKSISLTVDSWNSIDLSADNWTFEGDFVLGFDVGAFSDTPGDTTYIYAPIDEAAVPSANSWVNFGSWSDWASVATTNNLGDGEWGIRAVINSEGSATAAYNVYRSAAGGDFNLMFNGIGLSSPDYTDNFVQNGTEYCYGITTVYGTDESDMAGPVCGTPSPQTIVEYAHDDGSSNGSFNATDGNYLAVKFTPNSYPVDLYSAKYFIDGSNSGIAFVNVWDDDGENDMPGTVLLSGVPVSLVPGWSVADLSAYGLSITEGSFYVGWMEMSTTPPIGLDMDSPTTHSYINSTLGSGSWQGLTELGLSDGAIMIRCDVDTVNATVAIDGSSASLPKTFALKQNYPNPFNPTTTIIFDIAQSGKASLKIYDLTGKEVLSLIDKNMDAGHYQFGLNASNLSSGMYIYRLTSFSNKGKLLFNQSRKLVLMK